MFYLKKKIKIKIKDFGMKKKKNLPIPFFQDQFKVTLLLHAKFYKHKVYNSWGIFVINPNIYDNNYNNCHIL